METLHENNQKAIANWTAKDYANACRDFISNWCTLEAWYSSFMPEDENDEEIEKFYNLCKSFHNMGF